MNDEKMKDVNKKLEAFAKSIDQRVKEGKIKEVFMDTTNWWYMADYKGRLQYVQLLFMTDEGVYTVDTNENSVITFEDNVYAMWDISPETVEALNKDAERHLSKKGLITGINR